MRSLKNFEDNISFIFPVELQHEEHHVSLFRNNIIRNSVSFLKKEMVFRNITITLDATLKPIYLDAEGNFVFNSIYLDEEIILNVDQGSAPVVKTTEDERISLLALIKNLQQQLNENSKFKIWDAEKKLNGKGDVVSCLEKFSIECDRFSLSNNDNIEVLRIFLTDSAVYWYLSITKNGKSDWNLFKEGLI